MGERGPALHEAAAKGFSRAADSYEAGRPSYPAEALARIAALVDAPRGPAVIELGAGTGKFTRWLAASGASVLAVEPVAAFREKLAAVSAEHPSVRVVDGTAEAIPAPDGSADAVIAAQAFHWFRGAEALAEIHRVLRPGGALLLLWNTKDESVDWIARLDELMEPFRGDAPDQSKGAWKSAFASSPLGPLHHETFRLMQTGDMQTVRDRVASVSFVSALPEAERIALLERVERLVATHPTTAGRRTIEIPYRTDLYWCTKRKAPAAASEP